ncbi:MAG: acetyl-CoA carboxylase biotin carboxylase subunit [Chloroflexi bacterium]|nr:acetyl-CoA carboxylase biotin carboxylase subunit [Chloroflexota bacterium]OJV89643.1 MAG: acetyl-CoA carboxylase biotin carboxylase subunit [Chloroflexi bacterium 54-19]
MAKLTRIKKVLIANRGEIALRVIRACRDMGVATVAVYSEADRKSLHVREADEAYLLGPAPSKESYLRGDKIIEIAKKAGADAVHPGYGFLSERANFAQACQDAGLIFIGPPPAAIEAMGDKVRAKQIARAAGVPLVPGIDQELPDWQSAAETADRIGYPVLIKASAGGGGKGMRVVRNPEDIQSAFEAATREASGAFGYGGVYLEKMLENVKHVEIQLIADTHGNAVYMGERECSLQRRNQKMVEEAPSQAVDEELRREMGRVAVAAAREVGYVNAGTIEFLVTQDRQFYFMEMNTRLQVEHPVTELTTGFDIVAEQLRIADGQPLSFKQEDLRARGWAIECRITAEDPFNNFLPSVGTVRRTVPPTGPGVRLDSAVYDGYEVSLFYDPMIAKLITWGSSREEAIARMERALEEYQIFGIHTTIPYHQQLMNSEPFRSGNFYTTSLETNPVLKPDPAARTDQSELAAIMAALFVERKQTVGESAAPVGTGSNGAAPATTEKSAWKEFGRHEMMRRV